MSVFCTNYTKCNDASLYVCKYFANNSIRFIKILLNLIKSLLVWEFSKFYFDTFQ